MTQIISVIIIVYKYLFRELKRYRYLHKTLFFQFYHHCRALSWRCSYEWWWRMCVHLRRHTPKQGSTTFPSPTLWLIYKQYDLDIHKLILLFIIRLNTRILMKQEQVIRYANVTATTTTVRSVPACAQCSIVLR